MRSARRLALSLALVVDCGHLHVRDRVCRVAGSCHQPGLRRRRQRQRRLPNDYVELFNRGTTDVALDGLSLQYASATGTGDFGASSMRSRLCRHARGRAITTSCARQPAGRPARRSPADIDDTRRSTWRRGAGKVALVSSTTSLGCNGGSITCSSAQLAQIIDLVGYGTGASGANFFEGSAPAPTLSQHARGDSARRRAAPTLIRTAPTSAARSCAAQQRDGAAFVHARRRRAERRLHRADEHADRRARQLRRDDRVQRGRHGLGLVVLDRVPDERYAHRHGDGAARGHLHDQPRHGLRAG